MRPRKRSASTARRQLGFSLIEMLVAFSIMALSLGLIYRMAGGSARHIADAIQAQNATWLAEGILASRASVGADGWNEDGVSGVFSWRVESSRYGAKIDAPQPVVLHQIQLGVTWGEESHPRSLQLVTLLPERPAQQGERIR